MNKNIKILYLTQTYPFPANNGGDLAVQKHITELEKSEFADNLKMFFSTFNKSEYQEKELKIENRIFRTKKFKNKFIKNLIETFEFFTSRYSRSYHLVDTKELRNAILEYNPNIVIMEHVSCYKTLVDIKYKGKLVYLAQNIEADFNYDVARLERNIFRKIIRYVCGVKAHFTEKAVMQRATRIGCISASDYEIISKFFKDKTVLCAEVPEQQDTEWNGKNEKTLFFCGHYDFLPNTDAINWIINELAPKMPDIKFIISGKDTEKLTIKSNNVECLGFVTKEKLIDLYISSSAFLCPIIYGSGIKMKLVEALSYYMPVIATKEALSGMENLNINAMIKRDDIEQTVNSISQFINNKETLTEFQSNIKDNVIKMRKNKVTIVDIINSILGEIK